MQDQDFRTSKYVSLEMRGINDAETSSPEKDTAKFLKIAQISAFALAFALLQNKAPRIFAAISKTVVWKSK
jgi:hypothetical protein